MDKPRIPEYALSGSTWEKFTFSEFAANWEMQGKPYQVDTMQILLQLFRNTRDKAGTVMGSYILLKSLLWDMLFNRPEWMPEKFKIRNQQQEKFYRSKFNEYLPIIMIYNNLAKAFGAEEADRFMAEQMLPIILDMMKARFSPVEDIDSVESWLKQARDYLGTEIETDRGFEGEIYLAQDKSEMRFHVSRCAAVQIIRAYGLRFTAAALCMGDHITYHTVFPNLIFKRSHSLSVGDSFCDHEFRLRKEDDPVMDEDNYGDCKRIPGMRDLVREWEEKAGEIFSGEKRG
jgi:hypothetical protein